MTSFVRSRKALAVLTLLFAAAAIYLFPVGSPQSAQERAGQPRGTKYAKFSVSDATTADIRDRNRELARIEIESPDDRKNVEKLGRIVEDFGSFVVVSKRKNVDTGISGLRSQAIAGKIHVPAGTIDPLTEPQAVTVDAGRTEASVSDGYYIVQFGGIATDEWLESLRDAGVEILQYLPDQAFLVHGDGAAITKAAKHSRVRWTGRFDPNHKVSVVLKEQLRSAREGRTPSTDVSGIEKSSGESAIFDIAVFSRADINRVAFEAARLAGAKVISISRLPNNYFNVIQVEMPVANVEQIAEIPDVIRIDAWSKPTKEDERAAQIVAGNYSSPTNIMAPGYNPLAQFGVTGQGVTISVVDDGVALNGNGGFYLTPANTVDGPLRGASAGATGGHGHINASIIAGAAPFGALDVLGYNYGLGVSPGANIVNIPMLTGTYGGTTANVYNDTVTTPGPNGVNGFISNNSWGNGLNSSAYDSYTAQFDGFVRDASSAPSIDPVLLVFSAGNSGPGLSTLTRPKAAKNMIAVGNSENIRPEPGFGLSSADNMDDLRSGSSRGPTADGRIKPDIVAPGSYITGSRAGTNCSSVSSCFDANHSYSIGTSHAAPQVAGAAALFTQYWRQGHSGQNPSPALVKAAILNTGQEMNGLNTNAAALPNGNEGWGRINMKYMLSTGVQMRYVNETSVVSEVGETYTISGAVANSSKPVRLSLVWTDPPAAADPALVNNLNLSVTVGGNTYRGNVFSGGVSTTGGSSDNLNNVENVWLPAGIAAGTPVTIQVVGAALNGDGVLGNADSTDQHFALVAYNVGESAPTVRSPFDFDGDGKTDVSIFRPGSQQWWINRSSEGNVAATAFGTGVDPGTPVPADYTGDGKADIALWRNTDGSWYILRSEDNTYFVIPFGAAGDVPAPGDFDGDAKSDLTVFRASTGTWFSLLSSGGTSIRSFGIVGDLPVVGDYDGDSRSDVAIYRPGPGEWWIDRSSGGVNAFQFGSSADKAVAGDYTGDGRTDAAFWRPADGKWYILRSEDNSYFAAPFGSLGDLPVPGDYDGDGRVDVAVFRPASSTWFVSRSTAGVLITNFGVSGDLPLPNSLVR